MTKPSASFGNVALTAFDVHSLGDRDPVGTVRALELNEPDATAILYATAP